MATKNQIIKYLEGREKQALALSKMFEKDGFKEMSNRYFGEFELAQRVMLMLKGDLDVKDFI